MELPQNPTTLTTTTYDPNFTHDHLFHPTIEEDENSEWLSVFVEDCLSTPGNYGLPSTSHPNPTKTTNQIPPETLKPHLDKLTSVWKKKKRSIMKVKAHKTTSLFRPGYFKSGLELKPDPYPPLLHQSHWLADSELIFPTTHNTRTEEQSCSDKKGSVENKKVLMNTRRCTHCQADKTPLWRQGPLGKGTLCNACGVRWLKTGALFPEYRPANSPTFVRNLHSNVLRKVLKMREARLSSSGTSDE